VQIDAKDMDHIGAVHPSDALDGSYIVEFLREQDAFRYLKAATKARKAVAKSLTVTGNSTALASPPGLVHAPATELLQSPPGITSGIPAAPSTGHEVHVNVSGLPQHLMSQKMLEATLEQAGLEKEVTSITLSVPSKVQITLSNRHAADVCLEHFHGRKWNPSGGAVIARIVPGKSKKATAGKKGISAKPDFVSGGFGYSSGLNAYAPAYVHSSLAETPARYSQKFVGTSEASTTVSDEEAEQESWEADLKMVMSRCAFE
jgi:hypothetical protein